MTEDPPEYWRDSGSYQRNHEPGIANYVLATARNGAIAFAVFPAGAALMRQAACHYSLIEFLELTFLIELLPAVVAGLIIGGFGGVLAERIERGQTGDKRPSGYFRKNIRALAVLLALGLGFVYGGLTLIADCPGLPQGV